MGDVTISRDGRFGVGEEFGVRFEGFVVTIEGAIEEFGLLLQGFETPIPSTAYVSSITKKEKRGSSTAKLLV